MNAPASRARSLQLRLLVWVLALVTLVWLSAAVLTWFDAQHELDELLDGHLAQTASLLIEHQRTSQLVSSVAASSVDAYDDPAPRHKYAFSVAFQVFHEGVLVARSAHVGSVPMSSLRAGFETMKLADGTQWRVFATRGHETDVRVLVAEQTELRDDILWAVLGSVLKPLLFALPALVLAICLAVRRGLKPLRELGHAVAQRQPQATQAIRVADAPLEVQSLVSALNELFERIAQMVDAERRFTADAAHELRTPIAAIRAQAQVALAAQEPERAHALHNTLAGCDRATRLVEQLLTLARLEASAGTQRDRVDLGRLARDVAAELVPQALTRQQQLELDAPATTIRVRGNDILLGVLLRNLLDNALRYSPGGAAVHISVHRQGDTVNLQVHDSGPGLTDAQMAQLGQRFFRVLGSDQPGSGLGWSIVRRIAQVHGAQVQVARSARLGGLSVQVVFQADA